MINKGEKISISGVPETMIQTLYARAEESQKVNHLIYDPEAIEMVAQLDYDFSIAAKDKMMQAVVISRTLLLDRMVTNYLDDHKDAVIVNLACGLDTRCYRLNTGNARWYNLDLPEAISVRQRFFTENDRISMISGSAMDEHWTAQTDARNKPVLILLEGLTMYLTETDIQTILTIIDHNFGDVTVFMEVMSPMAVAHIKGRSIKASNAEFSWGIRSGRELDQLTPGLSFQTEYCLTETLPALYPIFNALGKLPFFYHLLNKIVVLERCRKTDI